MKKLTLILLSFTFMGATNTILAQQYGGSAYAYVEDSDGETRCINVTEVCSNSSESSAKSSLESQLDYLKSSSEKYTSSISYSIDRCTEDDNKLYGGSASAKVMDDDGDTRIINTTEVCSNSTKSGAKIQLLRRLDYIKGSGEHYVRGVEYDIDSCDN